MFTPAYYLNGGVDPWEVQEPTANETYTLGEALKLSSGKITKSGAEDVPQFIAQGPGDTNGTPVIRVNERTIYETTIYRAANDSTVMTVGTKYTLHTDGKQITTTSTKTVSSSTVNCGVAELVGFVEGVQTNGARVLVKF